MLKKLKSKKLITMLGIGAIFGVGVTIHTMLDSDAREDLTNLGNYPDAVNNLNDLGAYDYLWSGDFYPDAFVTRGQMAQILENLYSDKLPKIRSYTGQFPDFHSGLDYHNALVWAYEVGLIDGTLINGELYLKPYDHLTRTQMAKLLVTSFNIPYYTDFTFTDSNPNDWYAKYVSALYGVGIGRGDGNVFMSEYGVTRSHLAVFIDNLNKLDGDYKLLQDLIQPNFKERFITGNPELTWLRYSDDIKNFDLVGMNSKNQKVATYITTPWVVKNGVTIGYHSRESVRYILGEPITSIKKFNATYVWSKKETYDTYLIGNEYVTFFYDTHLGNVVVSALSVRRDVEEAKYGMYGVKNWYTDGDSERLMNHLMNETRLKAGLSALKFDVDNSLVARSHSQDMLTNGYFDHVNSWGYTPAQRLRQAQISYSAVGENLAYGQYDMFYAHNGLLNSAGHRKNILNSTFTHSLIGVVSTDTNVPYTTVKFYTPK